MIYILFLIPYNDTRYKNFVHVGKKRGLFMHNIYQERIMDHYHHSPYRGFLEGADMVTDAVSPSCGDHILFTAICQNGAIVDLKFKGEGSILGQAAASMLCEQFIGKPLEAVLVYTAHEFVASLGV